MRVCSWHLCMYRQEDVGSFSQEGKHGADHLRSSRAFFCSFTERQRFTSELTTGTTEHIRGYFEGILLYELCCGPT